MVVDPSVSEHGFTKDGTVHTFTDDAVYELGTLVTVWEEARRIRDADIAPTVMPTTTLAVGGVPATPFVGGAPFFSADAAQANGPREAVTAWSVQGTMR